MRTHYDNLQVKESASPEVIKGAYRHLSQKYHPDKHDDKAYAERVSRIINKAYEVLSDPVQKQAHDEWIARSRRAEQGPQAPKPEPKASTETTVVSSSKRGKVLGAFRAFFLIFATLIGVFIFYSVQPFAAVGLAFFLSLIAIFVLLVTDDVDLSINERPRASRNHPL